jgi:hypothetical protein
MTVDPCSDLRTHGIPHSFVPGSDEHTGGCYGCTADELAQRCDMYELSQQEGQEITWDLVVQIEAVVGSQEEGACKCVHCRLHRCINVACERLAQT